ncbi:MAG: AI-2E family transporter YdiK [Methylocella sp.]
MAREGDVTELQRDLPRITLGVLLIVGMIAASFWILRPFLPAAIWATMIVVSTWPLLLWVQARLWNKRALAVIVMSFALLMVFVMPLGLAVTAIVENAERFANWLQSIASFTLPPPPAWLERIPIFGSPAARLWTHEGATGFEGLSAKVQPYAGIVTRWFLGQIGGLGVTFVQFLLTVVFAAIMYAAGESGAAGIIRFGRRLAGEQGEASVRLAGQAIRGVAMGVVLTAIAQSGLGGLGLAICGVPFAVILTAVMFILCIAQMGPGLVLAAAVIWTYWSGDKVGGTVLLAWSLIVATFDNFMRPMLIKRGADLPLLLIFVGVVGGLLAFGLIGLFVGPVLLAVAYTLLQAWVAEEYPSAG